MGLSLPQLLVVLSIVIVLFGTKRLRTVGADLGGAIKGFRNAVKDGEQADTLAQRKPAETELLSRERNQSGV
ncbi:Sec-independent protein translocase subunit TatA [Methylomonas sp. SURF-2]|uniref:Sec-independent protein translocase protein TatA n=1 Tax=Methylomonas subterranea TaxID=2952225 RepID=A0ABT1TNE1_9GAMM|nr:Sec-independent protein translocase subunit TatA [Methylomonas sp. SURF-2]MCQ8106264.1 Sec-independent protein translocase subunit TatA [Methylomonas sp. SURF-2]